MPSLFETLLPFIAKAANAHGAFAECGVMKGATFHPLAIIADALGRKCYALDSFLGMAEPTERDRAPDGTQRYPQGHLDVGGQDAIDALLKRCDGLKNVRIIPGWIPEVLYQIRQPACFAFVHIDLDQYQPTAQALRWFWDHMSPGGIIACHDWIKGRKYLASLAFEEFCEEYGLIPEGPTDNMHGIVTKPGGE